MRRAAALVCAGLAVLAAGAAEAAQDTYQPVTAPRENLGAAVTSPLDDLNLRRVEIPEILVHAVADPYALDGLGGCQALAAEVRRLDEVLGPDRDARLVAAARSKLDKAGSTAVGAVRVGAEAIIPYRGIARRLSGAARHQQDLQEAINAGGARRGYLKGVGMRMNCAPPAAPAWFRPAAPPKPKPAAKAQPLAQPAAKPGARSITVAVPSWWPARPR